MDASGLVSELGLLRAIQPSLHGDSRRSKPSQLRFGGDIYKLMSQC